jgi:ribonuclease HI
MTITNEQEDDAEIKVYVDGSGQDDNAGAVAVMYRKGRVGPEKILHFHLGTLERHNNYEAEAVGLLLAMWMLRNQHVMGRLNVSIYVDSQALLKAIKKRCSRTRTVPDRGSHTTSGKGKLN